jgi:subfamily B ATP-binding cassette protein MsbA
MRRYSLLSQAMMERLTDRFEKNLRGLFAEQAPASGTGVLAEFQAENAVFFSLMMRYLRATALAAPLMELCGSVAVAALLYFGGTAVIDGRMTPGSFFAFLGAFLSAYAPIKNLARTNSDLQRALASGERIFELLGSTRVPAKEAP